MPRLRTWFSRLLGLFSKNRRDAEMAEEIQAHLDLLTERNIAAGMSPNEARNAALRLFGGIEQTKEIAREQRVWRWADEFVQDIRYGVRMLRRTPGFSILAILCLTLGIGTNAAALSWIEGILIRPYPLVAHPDRMFALNCTTRGAEGFTGLSYPDFIDLERNSTLFESFIIDKITGTTLSNGDRAERAVGGMVSANYFDALGVRPILGRGFRPEEGTGRNAHPVAVISYMTWKNRYKGDPDIIGKTQLMNGVQHTIIGMAGKYWPRKDPIGQRLKVKDKWMQIVGVAKTVNYETKLEPPKSFFYVPVRQNFFVGNALLIRTRETPGAITNALAREVHALDPTLAPYVADRLQVQVDGRGYTQRLAATLLAIFGGMALFLAAIGLYGVMSYSVSQSTRELGVRMALGATVRDLLRLVISRGLRLTIAGIAIGLAAALLLTRLMGNLLFQVSPRDPIAFGAALIILLAVALVACLLPARRATRIDPVRALRI